jgi:hypothetical protein
MTGVESARAMTSASNGMNRRNFLLPSRRFPLAVSQAGAAPQAAPKALKGRIKQGVGGTIADALNRKENYPKLHASLRAAINECASNNVPNRDL